MMDSRAIVRMGMGFYVGYVLRPYSSFYMGSMSCGLTRNIDRSSCVYFKLLKLKPTIAMVIACRDVFSKTSRTDLHAIDSCEMAARTT